MLKNLKELFPDYIVLLKIGNFYEAYNNDACIMSYLFGYKIKNLSSSDKSSGFPVVAYNKIISNLEKRNVNYIIIDKAHNYEKVEKMNYKRKNKYNDILDKAVIYR